MTIWEPHTAAADAPTAIANIGNDNMNNYKIGTVALGLMLSITLLAWARSPEKLENTSSPAPRAEIKGTYSHPTDSNYLYDQVEVSVQFNNGARFVLATRPGENIYVTIPVDQSHEKRLALVVMPSPFGEKVIDRSELLARESNSIGFRLMPYCLNSLSNSGITDKTTAESCRPRRIDDNEEDFVLPLSSLMKKDIAIGEKIREEVTGTEVTILGYRSSGYSSFQQINPYSKCCGTNVGVELCACTVLSPTSRCESGCTESDPMKKAATWESRNGSSGLN